MKKLILAALAAVVVGCGKQAADRAEVECCLGQDTKFFEQRYGKPIGNWPELNIMLYEVGDYCVEVNFDKQGLADHIYYSRADGHILSAQECQHILEINSEGKEWKTLYVDGYWTRSDGIVVAETKDMHYVDGNENLVREDDPMSDIPYLWSRLLIKYNNHIANDVAEGPARDPSVL